MRVNSSTRFAALAVLVGALACAGNKERTDTDETAAARDTTTSDTLGVQNPPGYRGMERDTTVAPQAEQQPSDTFLQNQGVGAPQDTSGYSGAEQVNPAGAAPDTTSMTPTDTSWTKPSTDTTGYNPSQQPGDSISR